MCFGGVYKELIFELINLFWKIVVEVVFFM